MKTLIVLGIVLLSATANAANTSNFTSNLPLMHVNTSGKSVSKTDEAPARVTLLDGATNRSSNLLRTAPELTAKIQIRGNSSAKFSKKQYDLEFYTPGKGDKKAPISLLGMPAHHKWVLAAPYSDRALIRNTLGFAIARSLRDVNGQSWYAPRTQAIELFLNGKYQGVYVLTEKIDGSKERVNLGKVNEEEPEKSPFIVKVEKTTSRDKTEFFKLPKTNKISYFEPKAKNLVKLMKSDPKKGQRFYNHIQRTMMRVETSIKAINDGDLRSYRQVIEPVSFQNFILTHEVLKNIDGFRRSIYAQYKNGRVHLGPVWDFDLALANLKAFSQMNPEGFQVGHSFYIDFNPEIFWFRTLLRDPSFQADLVRRYQELRRPGQALGTDTLMKLIDAQSGELMQAQARNFSVWSYNGVRGDGPVMFFVPKYREFSYTGVVGQTKQWLRQRLDWLDHNIQFIGRPYAFTNLESGSLILRPDLAN